MVETSPKKCDGFSAQCLQPGECQGEEQVGSCPDTERWVTKDAGASVGSLSVASTIHLLPAS